MQAARGGSATDGAGSRVGSGWLVVGASCLLMGTAFGTGLTLAVFLTPLAEEFGWSRGAASLAYSAFMLLTGT